MKFLNTRLDGEYLSKAGKKFRVESLHMSSKDLVNFYLVREEGDELLICSLYTRYLSKTGTKKTGEVVREVYGDYAIYAEYEEFRNRALNYPKAKLTDAVNRKIVDPKLSSFVDVMEKHNADFYHKLTYLRGTLIGETIQYRNAEDGSLDESLTMELTVEGKKVIVNKLKGVEYVPRDTEKAGKDFGIVNIQSLDFISMKKDITWMKERNYRIVNTEEDLIEYAERLKATKSIVGFDTETSGLRINRFALDHPNRDNLVGICLSIEDKEGIYIPIRQAKFNNLDEKFVMDTLQPYLCSKGEFKRDLVTHYGSFDWKVMYAYGWDLNITDDTYILQYLIDVREANAVKKLKVMSEKILGLQMIDLEDFFPSVRGGKRGNIQFSLLPYESVRHYGPVDSDVTRELYFHLRPKLPADMNLVYGTEIDLLKRLGKVEYYGIKIDIQKMIEIKESTAIEKIELEKTIYEMAGETFNINSGPQLARIMFDKLGYPSHGVTASGERSTGKDVLNQLSMDRNKDGSLTHPFAAMILDYKKKEKLLNSFLDKLLRENVEGYIFPKYNQAGTQSGRISGNNPNLQQTSGAIRELFIPDSDDYYFLVVDYSQVEYRIMAGLANQEDLVAFFRDNPEADFHIMMYAQMYGVDYKSVTSKQRKTGKTLNFGISYGMSPASLAIKLFGSNTKEQVQDAEDKIRDYFDSVANIRDYMTTVKDLAQSRGFVKTLFMRRRHIPEFAKDRAEPPKYYEVERGKRKAGNTVVQGTAADIMKLAHTRVESALDKANLDVRVVASIHDELVILVNKKYNYWYMINLVRKAMEIDLSSLNFPPLYIGANVGKTWGDGKKDSLEAPVKLMDLRGKEYREMGMHRETLENPTEEFAKELKVFALGEMLLEIETMRADFEAGLPNTFEVKTPEDAWKIQRLAKFAGSYIGDDADFALKGLIAGESVETVFGQLGMSDVLGDDYFDDREEELEADSLEEGDAFEINLDKLQNYYEDNKDKLLLESPEVRRATQVYKEDYAVMGFDRKLIVRIDKPNEAQVAALVEYFESVNVEDGYTVMFMLGSRTKATSYKTLYIDRLTIMDIIETHATDRLKK